MPVEDAMVLRPARREDLPALEALLTQVGLPLDGLAPHVEQGILAWAGDRLVGSAVLEHYGSAGLLRSVAVAPEWRGQGLGRRLVQAALDQARLAGVHQIYLLTETAPAFFSRLGFRPVPRTAVDPRVQTSVEFVSACPASAQAMVYVLAQDEQPG